MISNRRRGRIPTKFMVSWSILYNMVPAIFSLYMLLWWPFFLYCFPTDIIAFNSTLIAIDGKQNLTSAGEIFELGFFSPNESSNPNRYVGIWYYKLEPLTVVWVANREKPVPYSSTGAFAITEDGNLKVLGGDGKVYWKTNLDFSSPSSKTAKLLDSGNLILSESSSGKILWESFNSSSDTFLPGMKMDEDLVLTSWKSMDDPAEGNFTFQRDEDQFIIQKKSSLYWRSGKSGKFMISDPMLPAVANLLSNATNYVKQTNPMLPAVANLLSNATNYVQKTIGYENLTIPLYRKLVMRYNGVLQYSSWDFNKNKWSIIWSEPGDRCSVFNACGNFGSCNINNGLMCKCLPGFLPTSPHHWNSGEFSDGCVRKSSICPGGDKFLSLNMMKVREPDTPPYKNVVSENECRKECLNKCDCQAYSYDEAVNNTGRGGRGNRATSPAVCWIWINDLSNLEEEYAVDGHSLHVRVLVSDIEATARNCEPCGTNMIPYPLSTEPNCGDPLYFSFHCNLLTGQVSFQTPGGMYRVTNISPIERKFYIQDKNADNCGDRNLADTILKLNKSLPFRLSNWCDAERGYFTSDLSSKSSVEYEISWDPPLEPTCNSSADCIDWPDSTCNATQDGNKKCICNANFRWDNLAMNCTRGSSRRKMPLTLKIAVTCIVLFLIALSCTIGYVFYTRKRRVSTRQGHRNNIQGDHALHLYGSERQVKHLIDSGQFREDYKKGIDVPFFNLESILAATDNFSDANKLGQGGFGPVYKGKFLGDQEIAVKRLSSLSGQGLQEFKNEVVLIAKLQHRNLVRLLGYCISGEEKILLYEYMPNKSLDSFIFDRTLGALLNWEVRFNIILGVARGLLYLHQDSRLRIIHRDLKTSNILLDEEMNPKISDFGLARIFAGKQTEAATERIIGTYGYMSPEYALDGFFSVKSDVFSFGVVVLEIISGKKSTGFYQSEQALSLLGYAWKFWKEEKALELMDQTLVETCNTSEFIKCVNVGLLCVQEDPSDRPTMSNVVFMLGSETATLPSPKQPAFVARTSLPNTASSSSKQDIWSFNELPVTSEDGR